MNPWAFAATALLLFCLAAATPLFAERRLWISTATCALAFVGICAGLYMAQTRQLKILYGFIRGKAKGGSKERPRMGHATGKAVSLEQEIEHLLQAHSRQMESEAAQQKYYELLLDHVDTGVVSCEADGTIRWMNHAAERHIGMLRQVPEQWNAMASGAAAVVPFERHGATKDFLLSVTWFSLNGRPQRLFTLRDIRHVLEQQEIASWKTLTRVLTHEIMNSISPILSLTETLTTAGYDRPGQEEVSDMQQALKVIHRRSRGLLDFVENYRKLTRLPAPQYTDIRADELFSDLQRLFGDPRLVVDQPYPDFTFRADRGQVEQLLINLLKNARDASSATDREISLSLRRDTDEVFISVQDHGTGIPPEAQERVFVPFYTTKPDGSGIGLSLCKQIAFLHHGHLSLHSVVGKGSCFTLCLPRNA